MFLVFINWYDRLLPATSLRPPQPDLSHRQSLHATSRPPRPSKLPQEALRLLQCTLGTTAPSPPTENDPTVKPVAPAVRGAHRPNHLPPEAQRLLRCALGAKTPPPPTEADPRGSTIKHMSRWPPRPPYLPQGAQRLLACVLGATVPPPTTAIDCTGPPGINALGALVPSNPKVPDVTVPFVPRQMAPQAPPVSIGSGLAAALSSLNSEDGNLLMKSLHAAQQPARRRRRRRKRKSQHQPPMQLPVRRQTLAY